MAELKTIKNDASVTDFINQVQDEQQRLDAHKLLKILADITKQKPAMWGTAIVGYGEYHYKSERSAQQGNWPLIAFSPRKTSLTLYITFGFDDDKELFEKLGKHKTSVGCLYIKRLSDIDETVLTEVLKRSYTKSKQELDVVQG